MLVASSAVKADVVRGFVIDLREPACTGACIADVADIERRKSEREQAWRADLEASAESRAWRTLEHRFVGPPAATSIRAAAPPGRAGR